MFLLLALARPPRSWRALPQAFDSLEVHIVVVLLQSVGIVLHACLMGLIRMVSHSLLISMDVRESGLVK